MLNSIFTIFYWWLLIFGIGTIFAPICFYLFKDFFDRGYGLSKALGLFFSSWLIWWLSSLKIIPFLPETIYAVWFGFWILGIFLARQKRKKWAKWLEKNWQILLVEELVFLISLTFFALIRGFQPDIIGLEKYMDFGFVNSILKSKFMPPLDPWWQGGIINYYYFGHFVTALLTKVSGIASSVGYNLMIATLFGLSFVSSFSLGGNLWHLGKKAKNSVPRFILGGLISALAVNLMSNLHPLIYIWKGINNYWYPDATRFIEKTIHEFPFYTFVVADLHGHLNNLPNAVLMLAFLVATWKLLNTKEFKFKARLGWVLAGLALSLGVSYMTNAWDLVLYLGATGLTLWLSLLPKKGALKSLAVSFLVIVFLIIGSVWFTLPFHFNFSSFANGIGLVTDRSPFWQLLVLWGFWLFLSVSFISVVWFKAKKLLARHWLVLGTLASAWSMVVAPEVVYLKDIYAGHYRANTMFKMTFAAWVIFGIFGSLVIKEVFLYLKKPFKWAWGALVGIVMIGCLSYPAWAIRSYYNGLKKYQGLNGTQYMSQKYPYDWQAINWLQENVSGQPVILEAVGESYTDYARVSVHTGMPTVLGWRVHEWLWRGSFDPVGKRTEEVKTIYEGNKSQAKKLLKNYQVRYVFVGTLEKQSYPNLDEARFSDWGEIVFETNNVKVYELDLINLDTKS